MESWVRECALAIAALIAAGRGALIIVIWLWRMPAYQRRAVEVRRSWRDVCTYPEPPLLLVIACVLAWRHGAAEMPAPANVLLPVAGAALSAASAALIGWAIASFPAVGTGHYVLPEQRLIEDGAYAYLRHPLYLGAFGIWFGLTIAFGSPTALAVTLLYVIPSYLAYIRAEEEMMRAHFGDAYRAYRARVGGLVPTRRPRPAADPSGSSG